MRKLRPNGQGPGCCVTASSWFIRWCLVLGILALRLADCNSCSSVCSCLGSFVDCSYRRLTDIPDDLPVWTEVLHLQHNFIIKIRRDSLRNLTSLKELDIGNNVIANMSEIISELPYGVRVLKLNNNRILEAHVPGNASELVHLNVRSNNIYQIKSLHLASNLDVLDLSDNQLKNLGTRQDNATLWPITLSKLKLSHNRITTISKESFKSLSGLQTLDLSSNKINEIEGLAFNGLSSLTHLHLNQNSLKVLNDGTFWGLALLNNLFLQNNAITAVRKGWLYGLDTLQLLNLTRNKIEMIEDDCWKFTRDLTQLDLSSNSLTMIKKRSFVSANNLALLNLSNNEIIHVADDSLKHLRRLLTLDISDNQVGTVLEAPTSIFGWLKALQFLRLHQIGAVRLSGHAFGGLRQLQELDLSNNEISGVESAAFRELTSLHKLTLNTTSFVCACDVSGFMLLVQTISYPDAHFVCAFPPELRGKELKALTPSQLKCFDKPWPKIESDPQNMIVVVGANVTIQCAVSFPSESAAVIRWKKDDIPLGDSQVTSFAKSTGNSTVYISQLNFNDVDRSSSGTYQCVASNSFGSVFSAKARIAVHVFPTFVKRPQNVRVHVGSTAQLECSATGNPQPEVHWFKDGMLDFPAATQRRIRYEPGSDIIHIVNASLDDTGIYSCKAENLAGSVIENVTLAVVVSDGVAASGAMGDPSLKVLDAGTTALFECSAHPRWTHIRWLKNGALLLPTNRHFVLPEKQLLVISEITETDAGIYQCESVSSNDLGSMYTLRVVRKRSAWWDLDDKTTWIGIVVIAIISGIIVTSLIWLTVICHTRKKIRGGSSTGTDETVLPDECNPINGLHPSDSSLDSPMTDYGEEYITSDSIDEEFPTPCGRGKAYPYHKTYNESSSESPSFATYSTLRPAQANKNYLLSPHRSCNTIPRITR